MVVFTTENKKCMADPTSEKGTLPNYTIQPFTRQFFDAISSVQQLFSRKIARRFLSKIFLYFCNVSAVY